MSKHWLDGSVHPLQGAAPMTPGDLLLRQELCWHTTGFAFKIADAKREIF